MALNDRFIVIGMKGYSNIVSFMVNDLALVSEAKRNDDALNDESTSDEE